MDCANHRDRCADHVWDAGDMACGELLLELRGRLAALRPGEVLRLVTRDLGAILDVPAWCKLSGHRLVHARHPEYYIERKEV